VESVRERLATWLVTGPLGHLAGGVLDWAELLGRYWWARARGRPIHPWDRATAEGDPSPSAPTK
jgi:hypothetical protein